jgi:hypothetical protein
MSPVFVLEETENFPRSHAISRQVGDETGRAKRGGMYEHSSRLLESSRRVALTRGHSIGVAHTTQLCWIASLLSECCTERVADSLSNFRWHRP